MTRNSLGAIEKAFPTNEEEWHRSLLLGGAAVFAGVASIAMGVYWSAMSGDVSWVPILTGLALASLAAYVLILSRPRLLSIEIREGGVRINQRGGSSDFPWDEIRLIEESTLNLRDRTVRQVFIERADGLGFVANGLTISDFDRFVSSLREIAAHYRLEMRSA